MLCDIMPAIVGIVGENNLYEYCNNKIKIWVHLTIHLQL